MKFVALAAAAAALMAGTATAEPARAPNANAVAKDAAAQETARAERVVYICDRSDLTRRGFEREFGEVRFVSAEEALNSGESWNAPRCMSDVEAARLNLMMSR
ncbi:MAG: hypothetical protein LPJ86_05985 [Caulobacteraceae bacterium]|nr:hypothetical protein [Caulobacteraceae bacterium]MDX5393355.1 hypothetical protein [Caulobacteraceae bacterium]